MTAQERATKNHRERMRARGLSRFEVVGRDADRELIRSLVRCLTEDPDDLSLRETLTSLAGEPPKVGGILAALRASPLVGAELNMTRSRQSGPRRGTGL